VAIIYQISLHGDAFDARGKDWSQLISESGCKPDRRWKDPIHDRTLLKAEFGCSVSHFRVWQKIVRSGVAGIILEEDAVYSSFDVSEIDGLLKSYDSVWLGYRENTLGYWYNAHAYAISPKTASMLSEGFAENIIPADEWLPLKLKNYSNYFYRPELVKQIPRSIRPSTIEKEARMPHVITVGTDRSKTWPLRVSGQKFANYFKNIGKGLDWYGGTMEGEGGGQKINLIRKELQLLSPAELVMFVDGYDVIFLDTLSVIEKRFTGFQCDILFAAEKTCWPSTDRSDYFPPSDTPYRFLNSGAFIGKAGALLKFLHQDVADHEDDQAWMQDRFLRTDHGLNIKLDYEGYIFQCDDDLSIVDGQVLNGMCAPCVYHGNGGEDAKERFFSICDRLGYSTDEPKQISSPSYHMTDEYQEVAKDILITPLFTPEYCQEIIQRADALGKWETMGGDKFPAQEIRLKEIGLWDEISEQWAERLSKICEKHWHPEAYLGLRDAFTMRYSMDTQTELGLHTDASLFTGSVKLNNDYAGAELVFPRQNFSNKDVKVGQCILFPSMVTHGHKVLPLRGGKKYSLTMWTCRYEGDSN
jgi:GR25 family glycosyltransferase involved in LPS biosynthesis